MLTDVMVRQAKVTGSPYSIADFDGLYLHISAIGTKAWYFRYTWLDQRARLSLGAYPELSLREARELRDQARALIAKGINPRLDRKQKRQATKLAGENTFMAVYEKWMEHRQVVLDLAMDLPIGAQDILLEGPEVGGNAMPEVESVADDVERDGAHCGLRCVSRPLRNPGD